MSTLVDMKFNSFQQKMTLPDRLVERKLMGRENNIDKDKKRKIYKYGARKKYAGDKIRKICC